jgi:hypothetical protein
MAAPQGREGVLRGMSEGTMDIRKHRLPIAILLLVALGVGTLVALERRDAPDETAMVERVSPTRGLDRNAISAIEITRPGEPTTRVEIRDGEFAIVAPFSAEADAAAVNQMLDRLVDIEIDSVAATREKHHDKLEVSDERAIQVRVFVGETKAADLRIGAARGRTTMLRDASSPNVLGAVGGLRFAFDKKPDDLRDKRILTVDEQAVTSVTFESRAGKLTFARGSAEEEFAPAEGTETPPKFDPASVRARVMTLARLRASGFAPAEVSVEEAGLASPEARVTLVAEGKPVTLLLGGDAPAGVYAMVEGGKVIYLLPSATGQRFMPKASDFEATAPPPPPSEGSPGEIPPEILEQLQRQLQQQP